MIYSEKTVSKTGLDIPLFSDGRPFCSKYNPEREAVQFAENLQKADFFLIGGLGAGYHISEIIKKFPESRILAVENSDEDISFLKANFSSQINSLSSRITVVSIENLETELVRLFVPSVYPAFTFADVKSWSSHINCGRLIEIINNALETIKADFSVQAHFGKIWQKNIMENLKSADKPVCFRVPCRKNAVVAAAGPSLDSKIKFLKENADSNYVIATDTAYKNLVRNRIKVDCVVSVDGQFVSHLHFSGKNSTDTLFIFELTGENSAVRKIRKSGKNTVFSVSNHPFEKMAADYSEKSFIELDSTSGTVTVAALDFAVQCGFRNILVLGADFGYKNNKPYAKGTYLDDSFYTAQNRLLSGEKKYSALMFRTELQKKGNKLTTDTMEMYEKNFLQWCNKKNLKVTCEPDAYLLDNPHFSEKDFLEFSTEPFRFKDFMNQIFSDENKDILTLSLLPLISFLRNQKALASLDFDALSKLARNFVSRYNF